MLSTSRAGSSPSSLGVPRARVRSSPLESLGGSRVLAGAHAAWAPLLCAERNFTQNKRKYLQVLWEVETRMRRLLCFSMSYQIVIVFSFLLLPGVKGGIVCHGGGLLLLGCLFVWLVERAGGGYVSPTFVYLEPSCCVSRSRTNIMHLRRSVFCLCGISSNSEFQCVCASFEISLYQRHLFLQVLIPSFIPYMEGLLTRGQFTESRPSLGVGGQGGRVRPAEGPRAGNEDCFGEGLELGPQHGKCL